MKKEWILQTKETRRNFSKATWIPLRASDSHEQGNSKKVGYINEYFGSGAVAFPPENRDAAEKLSWSDIGIDHSASSYAYEDGHYSSIEEYQYHDKEPMGVELVFVHFQPVTNCRVWILNPDIVIALNIIKDGNNWVRPEENFAVVARELIDAEGNHQRIEIKREFLMDYLAARNLSLRISYYRQRVENVSQLEGGEYEQLEDKKEQRDGGRFELLIRSLKDVFGGSWSAMRVWRTDVDEDEDAPVMGPENNDNTEFEQSTGEQTGYKGVRVEGEFWRDEWIDHRGVSVRIRGDVDQTLPSFIVETDGERMASAELNDEDIGRWLWFKSSIINDFIALRGFSIKWYTAETGGLTSTSGTVIHFGLNSSDLITIYAYDIARLASWEQHMWAGQNTVPEGKVSSELLESQVNAKPASTNAFEVMLFENMRFLESGFQQNFGVSLFKQDIDDLETMQLVSRFASKDQASLLRLAKDIVRIFSDRLNVSELRKLSTHSDKNKLGSNKLLQDILAQKIGVDKAKEVFGCIAGAYDMRVGDAHPTGSKIGDAIKLAGVDQCNSFMRQGEQLIHNFGRAVWYTSKFLFENNK